MHRLPTVAEHSIYADKSPVEDFKHDQRFTDIGSMIANRAPVPYTEREGSFVLEYGSDEHMLSRAKPPRQANGAKTTQHKSKHWNISISEVNPYQILNQPASCPVKTKTAKAILVVH